jgi:hypothetical protein
VGSIGVAFLVETSSNCMDAKIAKGGSSLVEIMEMQHYSRVLINAQTVIVQTYVKKDTLLESKRNHDTNVSRVGISL